MAMTSGNGSFGSIESFNSGNTAKLPVALNAYGGNVGIGITNPSHTLQVAGAINCTSFLVNGTAVATGTGSVWGVNGSSAYYTSGNVGIGTVSPSNPLTIYAGGSAHYIRSNSSVITGCYSEWRDFSASGRFIIGCDGAGLANFEVGAGIIGTWSVNSVIFLTNASERMRITSTGVVGIGVTNPASGYTTTIPNARLTIRGGTAGQENGKARLSIGGDNAHYAAIEGAHTSGGASTLAFMTCLNAGTNSANPETRMFINSNGNVGIGTVNPSHLLQVAGAINCTSFLVNGTAVATGTGSVWGVSGSIAYYTSGFVGIGTIAPLSRFTIRCGYSEGETGGICIDSSDGSVYNMRLSSFVQANSQVGYRFGVNNHLASSPNTLVFGHNGNVGISTTAPITNLHVRVPTYSTPVFIVDAGAQGTDSTSVPRGIGKPLIGVGAYSWSNISSGDYYGIGFGYNANNGVGQYYPAEIGYLTQTTAGGEFGDLVFSTRPTTTGTTIASERMRITSTGSIGIGNTNPNTLLCVGPNGGVNQVGNLPGISMTSVSGQNMHYSVGQGTAGTNNVFLKWGHNATTSAGFGSVSCYAGANPLVLQEGGGNVGISTTSPAYKFVVQTATSSYGVVHTDGTISLSTWVGTSGGGSGGWLGTMTNHDMHFFTNASVSRMTINTSGQVGIGTLTPGNKLSVYSTTANDGITFQNAFNSSTGSIGLYTSTAAGNFILDGTADAGIVLPTGGKDLFLNRTTSLNTSMVVKGATGFVGIGTATPLVPLHVNGMTYIQGPTMSTTTTNVVGNFGLRIVQLTSTQLLVGQIVGQMCFHGWGRPNASSFIRCITDATNGFDDAGALAFGTSNAGTGAVETMRISENGLVGIGTASPATALHIARAVSATADYSLMTYYENTTTAYHDWAIGPYIDNGSATFAIRSGSNNLPASLVNMFYINSNGTAIRFPQYTTTGTLSINGSGGTISSSSDRRIKQDIVYQTDTADALARVLQLRPATFRFLEQDSVHLGFIAQDVEQCIPLAVDGKKYEWQWIPTENGGPTFDAEGNMLYQTDKDGNRIIRPRGLEDRAIIAMQTLAIQQLAAENTQLKQTLDAVLARLTAAGI
jgi:hypothetical protein